MDNILGELIKKRRKELRLSYRKLGELTGISHSHISSIEKGVEPKTKKPVNVSIEIVTKLAKGLKVTPDYLLGKVLTSEQTESESFTPTEIIGAAENMNLPQHLKNALDEYKTMDSNEQNARIYRAIDKIKNLDHKDQEALMRIIDSLSSR